MSDVLDYTPFADQATAAVLATAVSNLARRRDLAGHDPCHHQHPAIRLHLLTSLNTEIRDQILRATLDAYEQGYSPTQLAALCL